VNNTVLVFVVTVYSAIVLFTACSLIKVRTELERTIESLHAERKRLKATEDQALELVDKVVPLIEKTDWMTGQWKGQFNTLVRLENERNARVDEARRAIWRIPVVLEHIRNTTGADK
jgi:hypothetical protein